MNQRIEKLLEQVQVNEQIAHLAKQAGCTIDRLGYGEGNLEKFAELIVRECISVMDNTAKEARENFTYMDNDVPTTAHQFEIRKHFGVEK